MQHEVLTYQADGLSQKSHLFYEEAREPRLGVLVFPEAFGLGEHAPGCRTAADRAGGVERTDGSDWQACTPPATQPE
jgi:hypothetical protein